MFNKIHWIYKKYLYTPVSACTFPLALVPDKLLETIPIVGPDCFIKEVNILCVKILIILISIIIYFIIEYNKNSTLIRGENYEISVEYGDLLKVENCKRVIAFDECFTLDVGDDYSWQINTGSICGKYLTEKPITDEEMIKLILMAKVKPLRSKSKCQKKDKYVPGTLIPRGDDLLMAFTKLNAKGHSEMSKEDYIKCLFHLWKAVSEQNAQKDVCISILGSGTTDIIDQKLSQQELLDIMIATYKISSSKIKLPNKLRIICQRKDKFSLWKIGETFS